MDIRLDISGTKDIDLFALRDEETFNLENAILKALKSYVEGKKIEISVPFISEYENNNPTRYSMHIYVSEKKEPKLCAFINAIPDGYRAMVIKSIFRNYLSAPAISFLTHSKIVSDNPTNNVTIIEALPEESKKKGFAKKDNKKNIQKKKRRSEAATPSEKSPVIPENVKSEREESQIEYKEEYKEDPPVVSNENSDASEGDGMDFGMFGFVENY